MSDELREAAERHRKPYPMASVSGGKDYDSYYVHQQQWADLNKLADAFCDEHPPDDATPIDEAWLLAVGFDDPLQSGCPAINKGDNYISFLKTVSRVFVNGRGVHGVATRGQLRRLCSALGIELKEGV